MTHRATVQRDTTLTAGRTDGWNQPAEPDWQPHLLDCPCRVWFTPGDEIMDGEKIANVDRLTAIFPTGTDIKPTDRLAEVSDRLGVELFPGPIRILTVGRRAGHIAVTLEAV